MNPLSEKSHMRWWKASLPVVTIPPSPVVMTFRGWKEKQATSPWGFPIFCHSPFQRISLPALPPGDYKAMVVVDAGDEDAFGAQYTITF